jgi:hypothetical protein
MTAGVAMRNACIFAMAANSVCGPMLMDEISAGGENEDGIQHHLAQIFLLVATARTMQVDANRYCYQKECAEDLKTHALVMMTSVAEGEILQNNSLLCEAILSGRLSC